MADQTATVSLQKIVKRFILKYKIYEDDFLNYLEHAADCLRDLNISHLSYYIQANLTLDSVGKVAFPTDMIDHIAIGKIEDDVFYTFMQSTDLTVPTTLTDYTSSEWNRYFYFIDWPNRVYYCQSLPLEEITVRYISSGVSTSAETVVPIQCTQVIDSYLRWKQAEMDGSSLGDLQIRKAFYDEQIRHLQWQMLPTLEQFKDTWLGRADDDLPLITSTTGTTTSTSSTGDMNSYTTTVTLTAGTNTITTTITQPPYAVTIWDSSGNEVGGGMTIAYSMTTGVCVLTIYTVDEVASAIIRVTYKP
jgi:hypothetical protein